MYTHIYYVNIVPREIVRYHINLIIHMNTRLRKALETSQQQRGLVPEI